MGIIRMILQIPNLREILLAQPGLMTIGVTVVLFVAFNLILGFLMVFKGIKNKNRTVIYIGMIFFAGATCWGGVVFNFFYILILNSFPDWIWFAFFLIMGGFLFIFHFFWIMGISNLTSIKGKQRIWFLIILGVVVAGLEGSYWVILLTNIGLFSTKLQFPFIPTYSYIGYFYLTVSLSFFTIGGSWIAIESYKSQDPRLRLKSKFLIIYVIGITIGSLLEIYNIIESILIPLYGISLLNASIIASYTAKIILTISVICGYIGFMLPKRIERLFLKTKTKESVNVKPTLQE